MTNVASSWCAKKIYVANLNFGKLSLTSKKMSQNLDSSFSEFIANNLMFTFKTCHELLVDA